MHHTQQQLDPRGLLPGLGGVLRRGRSDLQNMSTESRSSPLEGENHTPHLSLHKNKLVLVQQALRLAAGRTTVSTSS
jgi:hypothetical protein